MTSAIETTSDVYRLLKNMGVTPRGVQLAAIESGLLEGRSIMVCSPTGSGKTLVGEMGLLRAVTDGSRGLYLVPLRALAGQVFTLLHDHYSDQGYSVGISTGDYQDYGQDLAEYDIVVTTYERGDSLLRHNAEWLRGVGCIVIDEIQTLGEGLRGARLEGLIMRMRRLVENLQIVALSATVGSPEALA
ncbi:MAG: DEAD/DEAH box helicase, partial [Candidatus Thorarchaeota archaeon]|nr:DEAD/DEAH box helicase [Candidatus Thorarchaeota archaeon]